MQDVTSFEMIQLTKRCNQKTSKCVGSGGGGCELSKKYIFLQGKIKWKKFMHAKKPSKYSCNS